MKTKPTCDCEDYQPEDPDDFLCMVCVCGHVTEEHGDGLMKPCKFGPAYGPDEDEP